MTPAEIPLALLKFVHDLTRSFVSVHPKDQECEIIVSFRARGYTIDITDIMPVGVAFFQNIDKQGIIYFEKGEVCFWPNRALTFYLQTPERFGK